MSTFSRTLIVGFAILGVNGELLAQANDVDCNKCVDTSDIAFQAVTTGKIQPKAVTTGKIKNGAVTAEKLSPELLSGLTASSTFRFVGYSTSSVDGDAGFFGMAAACQADFGADSRLASSKEIVESTIQPTATAQAAWVQPLLANSASANTFDYSGYPNPQNCNAWSTNGNDFGLVIQPDGGFGVIGCMIPMPVACSASQSSA